MKKIVSFVIVTIFVMSIWNSYADFKIISKEEMQKQSDKWEKIKNRKLYHTFEWTYIPNSKDEKLLKNLDKILIKINKENPSKLRNFYKIIDKKLEKLGKKYRDSSGKGVTKKNTKLYFLLEQINNKITDFDWNQDLGCAKNIAKAHMENNFCVSNSRFIEDKTWVWSQSYDYIFNHKWGNVIMTNCNSGYTKKETMENGYMKVLCVK